MANSDRQNLKIYREVLCISVLVLLLSLGGTEAKAACQDLFDVPIGGNVTIATSCVFSAAATVDGSDGGGIIINPGATLTVGKGQTIVFAPSSIGLVVDGQIIIDKTPGDTSGQLKKAYIWYTDSDEDSYPSLSTPLAQISAPVGGKRRMNFTPIASTTDELSFDYNDADPLVFPGTTCSSELPCGTNGVLGTCLPVAAQCLSTCQRCNGADTSAENITAGYVCTLSGTQTPASCSDYCDLSGPAAASNNCQYYTNQARGCSGNGLTCEVTNRASCNLVTCSSNQATRNATSCASVTASNYCSTAATPAANVNVCQYTQAGNSYTGCTGSGTNCGATQLTVPGSTITCGANTVAGTGTSCTAVTCSNYCNTSGPAAASNTCQYYANQARGCSGSGATCETTNRVGCSLTTCGVTQATGGAASCSNVTASISCDGAHYACTTSLIRETSYRGCAGSGITCDTTKRATSTASCPYSVCYSGGGCSGSSCVATSTAQTTNWSAGTYYCSAPGRCVSGVCRTCGGVLYDDSCSGCASQGSTACWHGPVATSTSCTTACSSYGGCAAGDWDLDSQADWVAVAPSYINYATTYAGDLVSEAYFPPIYSPSAGSGFTPEIAYSRSLSYSQSCDGADSGNYYRRMCVCQY